MYKRFLLWGSLIFGMLIATGLVIYVVDSENADPIAVESITDESFEFPERVKVRETDHTKGNPDAEVVIVKYSDFQCPACFYYASFDHQLSMELGESVLFVYRHFPLSSFQYARLAAQYAEAAGRQNKFWEMHDLIYVNQELWVQSDAESYFRQFAESIDLNMEQLNRDLSDPSLDERIRSDYEDGIQLGVNSVPSIFINGKKVQNPMSLDAYRTLIMSYN